MALSAASLTTLATLKAELGEASSTHDSVLERLIEVASEACARYCNRTLHYAATVAERVPTFGGQILFLKRTPIVSITSIEALGSGLDAAGSGVTLDAASYTVKDAGAGTVFRLAGWRDSARWPLGWVSNIAITSMNRERGTEDLATLVTYSGGYVTPGQHGTGNPPLARNLPFDLEQVAIELTTSLWRRRGQFMRLNEETEDAAGTPWPGAYLSAGGRKLLDRYRRLP
jgi:hypothetical protein